MAESRRSSPVDVSSSLCNRRSRAMAGELFQHPWKSCRRRNFQSLLSSAGSQRSRLGVLERTHQAGRNRGRQYFPRVCGSEINPESPAARPNSGPAVKHFFSQSRAFARISSFLLCGICRLCFASCSVCASINLAGACELLWPVCRDSCYRLKRPRESALHQRLANALFAGLSLGCSFHGWGRSSVG